MYHVGFTPRDEAAFEAFYLRKWDINLSIEVI